MEMMNSIDEATWFLDDRYVYRAGFTTEDGYLTTIPPNGALYIFNPTTGQLYLQIIHKSEFQGQMQPAQLAFRKAAEGTAALLRSLHVEKQPKEIYLTGKRILAPLQANMHRFSSIVLKESDWGLPFQALLRVANFGNLINQSTESHMYSFNLYDDWRQTLSAKTVFSRVMLILRALHVQYKRAKNVLDSVGTGPIYIWPRLKEEEWVKAEVCLRNLIVLDHAWKHSVDVWNMTEDESSAIILGDEDKIPLPPPQSKPSGMKGFKEIAQDCR